MRREFTWIYRMNRIRIEEKSKASADYADFLRGFFKGKGIKKGRRGLRMDEDKN